MKDKTAEPFGCGDQHREYKHRIVKDHGPACPQLPGRMKIKPDVMDVGAQLMFESAAIRRSVVEGCGIDENGSGESDGNHAFEEPDAPAVERAEHEGGGQ